MAAMFFILVRKTVNLKIVNNSIVNMDETPIYYDMPANYTLSQKGAKSVDVAHSGHEKDRITVVLTITAGGAMLNPYVLFKNIIKAPSAKKCPNPNGLVLNGSKSGTMDSDLVVDYVNRVIEPYSNEIGKKLLIFWDSLDAHCTKQVMDHVRKLGHTLILIPARGTSYLQPLDVSVNAPFKQNVKDYWDSWIDQPNLELTREGNIKKASYSETVKWVYDSARNITTQTIRNSFVVCGICFARDKSLFNDRLGELISSVYPNNREAWDQELNWDDVQVVGEIEENFENNEKDMSSGEDDNLELDLDNLVIF
jgi:hypothetical protein